MTPLAAREAMLREAISEARSARERGEIPVGAVLARGNEILARAGNRVEELHDPSAHAEMLCVREACAKLGRRRLPGCTLYVTLEPCPMCAGLLAQAGLDEIVFGARDALAGCCGSVYDLTEDPALPYGRTPSAGGLLEAECRQLLQDFFKARRKSDA